MTDRLVWIDCEMTGLDLARDALIEIACLVTDGDLAVLDEGIDLVIKPPAEAIDNMLDVVREMHTASGLLQELARRWYPRVYFASPPKHGGHRALADIRESIQELRYYRETVFVPPPGPDSVRARQIAARYAIGTGPDDQESPAQEA